MLTDMQLKALKPAEKIYKVSDQRGLYVAVTRTGVASFRFDYRLHGRRETLVIGQYDSTLGMRKPRESNVLDYGMSVTLAEARLLLARAHRSVEQGESPSRANRSLATGRLPASPALLQLFHRQQSKEQSPSLGPEFVVGLACATPG